MPKEVTPWILVAGARPNFMKIAPLIKAIEAHNDQGRTPRIQPILVHTGQHYDEKMSQVFFRELGIRPPDVNLEAGSGSHAAQTAQIMMRFEPVCLEHRPDWVIVVGDVNSTVACTLVATKLGLPVAHVEAGLRSGDRSMPEEINRLVTDTLADLLLTPSPDANENLRREGIPDHRVHLVGNIMIDALVANLPQARASAILSRLGLAPSEFSYVTLHRPANVDSADSLRSIVTALEGISHRLPIVFPVHPRTRQRLQDLEGWPPTNDSRFHLLDPVGYHDSLCLTENARVVITDSGGLQEEATYFRTPCLTLRPNTERPVTITEGSNRLSTPSRLTQDLASLLPQSPRLGSVPALWDGQTASRVVDALLRPRG